MTSIETSDILEASYRIDKRSEAASGGKGALRVKGKNHLQGIALAYGVGKEWLPAAMRYYRQ